MKSVISAIAVLLLAIVAVQSVHASHLCGPHGCAPQACCPPVCMPSPVPVYPYGGGPWCGPCVWVQPCRPPFNGVLPMPQNQGLDGGCPLPQHPYARSPRDYFMYYDR